MKVAINRDALHPIRIPRQIVREFHLPNGAHYFEVTNPWSRPTVTVVLRHDDPKAPEPSVTIRKLF